MITINSFQKGDWPIVWKIIVPVFRAGETYTFSPATTEVEAHKAWIETSDKVYVAKDKHNNILGTYYLKPNQPGLGSHVCNCGYIVSENARGKGIAAKMCEHSQAEAKRLGFLAMQFNCVVSTNEVAIRLWQKLGYKLVGTLPRAYKHKRLGFVDAFVMYKWLD